MATRLWNGVYTALSGKGKDFTEHEVTNALALLPPRSFKPDEVESMVRDYCTAQREYVNAPQKVTRFWHSGEGRLVAAQTFAVPGPDASSSPLPDTWPDIAHVRQIERQAIEAQACARLRERCAQFVGRLTDEAGIYKLMHGAEIAAWEKRRALLLASGTYFEETTNPMCVEEWYWPNAKTSEYSEVLPSI